MAMVYVRRFHLKDSLSDAEVLDTWTFMMEEMVPALQNVVGVHSAKIYLGAGALRADLRLVIEMDDAGVYERCLADPQVRTLLGRGYGAIDLTTSTQTFIREVTPELVRALSSTG
jgi:hypothetical protein